MTELTIDNTVGATYLPPSSGPTFVISNNRLYIAADVVSELSEAVAEMMEWLRHPNSTMEADTLRMITEMHRERVERALAAAARASAKGERDLDDKLAAEAEASEEE